MPVILVNRLSIVYNAVTWCTKNKEISIIFFLHPKKEFLIYTLKNIFQTTKTDFWPKEKISYTCLKSQFFKRNF